MIYFNILAAMTVYLELCRGISNPWIDYMVTVEQPVTLVTHNRVTRQNGTCCSPIDSTDCNNICPDDPSVAFKLVVCFRGGYVKGYSTDAEYCPLGALRDFAPNSAPGAQWAVTPRPEAATLERQYPGSVQLLVRITAMVNGQEVHVDDVWVFGQRIPADGTFRRITYLSMKQIAIVGVNARVNSTNGATSADCGISAPTGIPVEMIHCNNLITTKSPISTEASRPSIDQNNGGTTTTTSSTPSTEQNNGTTTTASSTPSTEQNNGTTTTASSTPSMEMQATIHRDLIIQTDSTQRKTTYTTGISNNCNCEEKGATFSKCIGIGLAAGTASALVLSLIIGIITCCKYRNSMRKVREEIAGARPLQDHPLQDHPLHTLVHGEDTEGRPFQDHPLQTLVHDEDADQPLYEEINCVHIQ